MPTSANPSVAMILKHTTSNPLGSGRFLIEDLNNILLIGKSNTRCLEGTFLTTIGVYILSYNRPEYLQNAVRSVLNQSRRPDRIVILDNGSEIKVKEAIATEIEKGVIWVGTDENHPSIWNHRRVLEMAEEDLFYLMHDDDCILPTFIERQVDFLSQHPEVVASGCNGYLIDQSGHRIGRRLKDKGRRRVEYYENSAAMAELYSRSFLPYPSIVYRNKMPQRIGFDDKFGQQGDVIFIVRLANLGPIAFLEEDLFEYRIHQGQDSNALREDLYRLKEDFLIETTRNDPIYGRKVIRRVRSNQTRRWLERVLSAALVHRSLRGAIEQLLRTKPPRLDLLNAYWTILIPIRYGRRFLDKL
jgi:GT2 family glycosyltransferase